MSFRALLLSTYELGRPPYGLASAAAWLEDSGCAVRCIDLSRDALPPGALAESQLIALHLPMHTATRLAARLMPRLRAESPGAAIGVFGLYAPLNEPLFRSLGASFVLGGECEEALAAFARRLRERGSSRQAEPVVSLGRIAFRVPSRAGLPGPARYARVRLSSGEERLAGATEASRGCKHRCRHCPVVPVYGGRFRVVPAEVVLADIAQQVEAGARHITFGDPDFWNGIAHARRVALAVGRRFPGLTFDVTIKIEHLLRHGRHLPELREAGCILVTSAVESFDDRVLALLEKGHTGGDVERAAVALRESGIGFSPTFIPFTPWTTARGYRELLERIAALELEAAVAPVQLAVRLLLPAGSRMLELPGIRAIAGPFDPEALVHPWRHADPRMDALQASVRERIEEGARAGETREETFARVRQLAGARAPGAAGQTAPPRGPAPYLTEPWFC